jgi:ADP-ribose pyrophosphatase
MTNDKNNMKIDKVEKLTSERWVNLFAASFEHRGHHGRWVYASRKPQPQTTHGSDAVIVVPVLRNPGAAPQLVLIKEFRVPVGGYAWAFPAGLLEPGETVEDTVRRELREETGLEVSRFKHVSPPLFSSSGLTDETAAMAFVDVYSTKEGRPTPDASEEIEVMTLNFTQVCQLCDDPNVQIDAKAWTMLYHYKQLGRIE